MQSPTTNENKPHTMHMTLFPSDLPVPCSAQHLHGRQCILLVSSPGHFPIRVMLYSSTFM